MKIHREDISLAARFLLARRAQPAASASAGAIMMTYRSQQSRDFAPEGGNTLAPQPPAKRNTPRRCRTIAAARLSRRAPYSSATPLRPWAFAAFSACRLLATIISAAYFSLRHLPTLLLLAAQARWRRLGPRPTNGCGYYQDNIRYASYAGLISCQYFLFTRFSVIAGNSFIYMRRHGFRAGHFQQ